MSRFEDRYNAYRAFIEDYLKDVLVYGKKEPQTKLFESMEYSLLGGGKRLRAILALEFCRLCCGDWHPAVPFAAAVEMVHTYSLIHDDLPCMDDDDFRRGRPTNHKVYGEAIAVLAGDALLTDAFSLASSAELPAARVNEAIKVLAGCAGSMGMVGGQALDIMSEERTLTEEEVVAIQTRKTGKLISAACAMGVLAGGGTALQYDSACVFATGLGIAFQIRDDMLDVIGNAEEMGKGVGTDEAKNTFVRLYGLERCEELIDTYTQYAIDSLKIFDDTEYLCALAKSLTQRRN